MARLPPLRARGAQCGGAVGADALVAALLPAQVAPRAPPHAPVAEAAVAAEGADAREATAAEVARVLALVILGGWGVVSRAEPRAARRAERLRTTRPAGLVMGLGLAAAAPLARPDVLALAEAHVAEELGATLIGGGTRCAEPRALRVGADRQVERQELQNFSLLALGGQRGWDLAATWQQQSLWLLQHSGHRTSRPFPERVVRVSCQLRRRRHAWRATKGGQAWFSLRCPRLATGAPPTPVRREPSGALRVVAGVIKRTPAVILRRTNPTRPVWGHVRYLLPGALRQPQGLVRTSARNSRPFVGTMGVEDVDKVPSPRCSPLELDTVA